MNETFTVALDLIDWKADDNPRDGTVDQKRMAELRETDPSLWPPITIAPDGSGRYRGIDGFARYEVARQLGYSKIAVVAEMLPTDIRSRAFDLNQHGWALSIAERKTHAGYLKERYPDLSDREIARRCGLSPTTVGSTAPVQNGQQWTQRTGNPRRDLAKAAIRYGEQFDKFQERITGTFLINPNRPQSVAAVLSEYAGADREWLAEARARFLEIADFMRSVAQEIKKQKTPAP